MNNKIEYHYLELIKKTLSFMLWPEPPEPIILQNPQRTFIKRKLVFLISKVLDVVNLEIVRKKKYSLNERSKG